MIVILTQLWLIVTGNFAWLNWITVVLAASAIADSAWHWAIPAIPADLGTDAATTPVWWAVVVLAASALILVLSFWPVRNLLSRRQLMNASFNRWMLVNAYGAFGTVTKRRIEIVVEGTLAEDPDDDSEWREYGFKGKPGDLRAVPRQWAPYHLRLDWLMWFLPLGRMWEPWFEVFLLRLLEADAPTLALLRTTRSTGRRRRGCACTPTTTGSPRTRSSARRASAGSAPTSARSSGPPGCGWADRSGAGRRPACSSAGRCSMSSTCPCGIAAAPAMVATVATITARNTVLEAAWIATGECSPSPEFAMTPFAIAPKIATPTALPIERRNMFAPVTTPRCAHGTDDCAAMSVGEATRPSPRPTTKHEIAVVHDVRHERRGVEARGAEHGDAEPDERGGAEADAGGRCAPTARPRSASRA